MQGRIIKVSGPLVIAENMTDAKLYDVVNVGTKGLIGEIIELRDDKASIQVYEETSGLTIGEPIVDTGLPLSVELAPGLIGNVFDGIGRSLTALYDKCGDRITVGEKVEHLSHSKKWEFIPCVAVGDVVECGDVLGEIKETSLINHKIMVHKNCTGKVIKIEKGVFNIDDCIAKIQTSSGEESVTMLSKWPVRISRPYKSKLDVCEPLVTGQRVIDTFFPIAKGGVAAVPGPFGSGKTIVQHQLAKWSEADVVVYIGCGERGNEMTDVLNEFPQLKDPKTGKWLMEKTILVANTSDMPVAAREASIYTGITLAEYYRDMGYSVVIMADSTSRWAEALREMSGRLEEMPGEEGYPAYLSSRLADFYERAGKIKTLGQNPRDGSITAIGAVSPQGGDLSEPVAQATLRIVKVFWGLSSALAYKRHFPAIDWLISYSGYSSKLSNWYKTQINDSFNKNKNEALKILQEEAELNEIVQLVGFDVLSTKDKITLEIAQMIKEDFLHQNAFDAIDTYTSLAKQTKMLQSICNFSQLSKKAVEANKTYSAIMGLHCQKLLGRMKMIEEKDLNQFDDIDKEIEDKFVELLKEGGANA